MAVLDLTKAPFHLPAPAFAIEDWVEGHPKRVVGLWTRAEIAAALARRRGKSVEQHAAACG